MRMKDRIVVLVKAFSELGLKAAEKMVEEGASAVILLGSEEESQKGEALKEKYPQTIYFLAVNTGAVSYTHLDVYKRQGICKDPDR